MADAALTLVIEQFPDLRHEVTRLFERDDVFRELCEDYQACSFALVRREPNEALRREFEALRLRLENELLGRLHDAEDAGGQE
jgi:hypothetical protein